MTTFDPRQGAPGASGPLATTPADPRAEDSPPEPAAPRTTVLYVPHVDLGPLFHDVQLARLFPDSKTLVDARPRFSPADIVARYTAATQAGQVNLEIFVQDNFELPEAG
jgi:alpha,alpha-trehalase